MKRVEIASHGNPDAMKVYERETPLLTQGECLIDVNIAGVNFIDTYFRSGLYSSPLPFTPGFEGVGRIREISQPTPHELFEGQRVGWVMKPGTYSQIASVPVDALIPIPDDITDEQAASILLQGMTAHYLTFDSYRINPGDVALVHAGSGGVGLLLTQIIKKLGGIVIATASTGEKREHAISNGADFAIEYEACSERVMELTDGVGVSVVYDGIGKETFLESIASLKLRGTLAVYGYASGAPTAFELKSIGDKSIFLTRPTLAHFIRDRIEMLERANYIFQGLITGDFNMMISKKYDLADAPQAHRDLEARTSIGKILLLP